MEIVQGPDFPTGGTILGREGIRAAYSTGRGRVVIRAKAFVEESNRGSRFQIVVTELPYQVNKAALLERIAELVKDGKIDGISDLRDESDRTGMRMIVELKRDAQPMKVLNNLFKHTALQQTFGINMLALVEEGMVPRVLTLKRALQEYVAHRQIVITRRTEFELERARRRAHILEGLKKALDIIDQIIATIRKSRTTETARNNLMSEYEFTRGSGAGDPRHAPRPPGRPRAQEDRGRAQGSPQGDQVPRGAARRPEEDPRPDLGRHDPAQGEATATSG